MPIEVISNKAYNQWAGFMAYTSLQPLTQRQQLFQLFDDAFLLGKGGEG